LDKNGEIENYYNPSSDTLLYNALKQRLQAHGGDGKKAFAAFNALKIPSANPLQMVSPAIRCEKSSCAKRAR
jgi:hypothetical protein